VTLGQPDTTSLAPPHPVMISTAPPASTEPDGIRRQDGPRRTRRSLHRLSVVVLVVGLVVTGALAGISRISYLHNEQRLSNLQTNLTASALEIAPVDLERRLGQAGGIAAEAKDPVATFKRVIAASMQPAGPFSAASLALVQGGRAQILVHLGTDYINSPTSSKTEALFEQAAKTNSLITTRVFGRGLQRFGYLMSFVGPGGTYVASAGESLPGNRRFTIPPNSPEAGLDIAIYFGSTTATGALVETNASHLPLAGTVSKATVPFGTHALTLVVSPTVPLSGRWSDLLPWGILVVGLLFTLGIVAMAERLVRRRQRAEELADENERLYAEQRTMSVTLQRSLLPKVLPTISEVELASRYIPGEAGAEVGGDWYSVIEVGDLQFVFVVGDVSGRGLSAASVMAGLRYTIRACARLGLSPAATLDVAAKEISISVDKHFATVLVGHVDNERHELTIACAGHPPALLLHDGASDFLNVPIGPPLGVGTDSYRSMTTRVTIPPNSTLIAYTDGLIERRGEPIDVGMERLRRAASVPVQSIDALLTRIVDELFAGRGAGADDDTAILGIRWRE
jgi:serine phosphatase RsbU (regulator of sigma subunit)